WRAVVSVRVWVELYVVCIQEHTRRSRKTIVERFGENLGRRQQHWCDDGRRGGTALRGTFRRCRLAAACFEGIPTSPFGSRADEDRDVHIEQSRLEHCRRGGEAPRRCGRRAGL